MVNPKEIKHLSYFLVAVLAAIVGLAIVTDDYRISGTVFFLFGFIMLLSFFMFFGLNRDHLLIAYFMTILLAAIVYRINLPKTNATISEIVIIILFFIVLMEQFNENLFKQFQKKEIVVIGFAILYVMGGLTTALFYNGGFNSWISACLIPALILYISFSLINEGAEIEKALFVACFSMAVFALFTTFIHMAGYGKEIPSQELGGVFSSEVEWGQIVYTGWGTWFGAMTAMVFPVFFLLSMMLKKPGYRIFYVIGSLVTLYFAYRSSTRGGIFGLSIGTSAGLLLSYFRLKGLGKMTRRLMGICILIFLIVGSMNFTIHPTTEKKFVDVYKNRLEAPNIQYRITLLKEAYTSIVENPIGRGFSALWIQYSIDEANFFSWSAYGIGLLGVIGFWGIFTAIIIGLIKGLLSVNMDTRFFSIIGISTVISTFIAANSSQQILAEPQTIMPFWLIVSAVFKAGSLPNILISDKPIIV